VLQRRRWRILRRWRNCRMRRLLPRGLPTRLVPVPLQRTEQPPGPRACYRLFGCGPPGFLETQKQTENTSGSIKARVSVYKLRSGLYGVRWHK
jgi:hypothetical protein